MASTLIVIGLCVICFLIFRSLAIYVGLTPIVFYLVLGWIAHLLLSQLGPISLEIEAPLSMLAKVGVVLLLFHIGLESHLSQLIRFLGRAGLIALVEIAFVGASGWIVLWLFSGATPAALVTAIALTATSIGVATASWPPKELVETSRGALLLDIATIDDILGVLLMALTFAFLPHGFNHTAFFIPLFGLLALVVGCYLFSHFVEPSLIPRLIRMERLPDAMLTIVAIGLVIASLAALAHISFAIGAFFAGIAFSRDPQAVRLNISMQTLMDLFIPFFFFWIGYQTTIAHLLTHWWLFVVLLSVTLISKFVANWLASRSVGTSPQDAVLIGVSMVPRAEVTMIIMENALILGLVTREYYSVVASIVFISCLATPLFLKISKGLQPAGAEHKMRKNGGK